MSINIQYCCDICDWENIKYTESRLPVYIKCKRHFCKDHGHKDWYEEDEGIYDDCLDCGERFD